MQTSRLDNFRTGLGPAKLVDVRTAQTQLRRVTPLVANGGLNPSRVRSRRDNYELSRPDVVIRGYPLKRGLDIIGSVFLLITFAPLMLLTALVIWVLDPGPVLFAQRRIGASGLPFKVLKFRTMRNDAEAVLARLLSTDVVARREWMASQKLVKDPRVTLLGNFLRRSSIDELPQLLNILKGEMSLVGPRPIVPDESVRYGRRIQSYRAVKPGLTGLWQVSGRNNTSYARRVALDVAYSRKIGLALDLRILLATIPAVLASEGCY